MFRSSVILKLKRRNWKNNKDKETRRRWAKNQKRKKTDRINKKKKRWTEEKQPLWGKGRNYMTKWLEIGLGLGLGFGRCHESRLLRRK